MQHTNRKRESEEQKTETHTEHVIKLKSFCSFDRRGYKYTNTLIESTTNIRRLLIVSNNQTTHRFEFVFRYRESPGSTARVN